MPSQTSNRHRLRLPENDGSDTRDFCIPIPIDRDFKAAFLGAIRRLSLSSTWQFEPTDRRYTIAAWWQEYYHKIAGDLSPCGEPTGCVTKKMYSASVTYHPCDPHSGVCELPEGYTYAPFTIVDDSLIGTVVSQWGLGYQVGDVFTDLLHLPQGSWSNILEGWRFFPRITLTTPAGSGLVRVTFLNIPQGGRALIVVDDNLDLLNLRLVELNKDTVSIPPETQVAFDVDVRVEGEGTHLIEIAFLPTVDDTPLPIFFGGGIREFELCGFGMPSFDPCCPDDQENAELSHNLAAQSTYNDWVNANGQQAQLNRMLYDGTPQSLYPNAGSDFDSNGDGLLCDAINSFVTQMCSQIALQNALQAALIAGGAGAAAAIGAALAGLTFGMSAVIGLSIAAGAAIALNEIEDTVNNQNAQQKVRCCLFDGLQGQELTAENFSAALDGCGFDPDTPEEKLRAMIARRLNEEGNYLAFLQALNLASDGDVENCQCDCDPAELEIIPVSPMTTATRIDATHWHIQSTYQPGDDPARPDARSAHIRDAFFRCYNVVGATQGMSDSNTRHCDGSWHYSIGGTSGDQMETGWRQWGDDIDTIIEIICGG